MIIMACIYAVCALVWGALCAVHWCAEGVPTVSTALYGLSAVCWVIAAVLNFIRISQMGKREE